MLKEMPPYKGFVISYQDPPLSGIGWEMNIVATTPGLLEKLSAARGGQQGSAIIVAPTFAKASALAIEFIDHILG
jgi:hypothetical protein